METRKIYDADGTWWINTSAFPFVDPTSGCRFEPQVPTRAKVTDWMKTQPVIQVFTDPNEKPKAVIKPLTDPAEKPKAASAK